MKKVKGVTSYKSKGRTYWRARVDGEYQPCGSGEKGRKLAEAARAAYVVRETEKMYATAGIKVKRVAFKNVKELVNWYMSQPSIQAQNSYRTKEARAGHIIEYFGYMRLGQVEGDEQEQYRENRRAMGIMDATVDVELMILSAAYTMARERKKIPRDVIPGKWLNREGKLVPRRPATKEEWEKLVPAAATRHRDAMICAYESGMREGEIYKLTVREIKLNIQNIDGRIASYIDLKQSDMPTKTHERIIPISPILKPILERRIKDKLPNDRIFHEYENLSKNMIKYDFKETCNMAGVRFGDKINEQGEREGIVFHCLRHSYQKNLEDAGLSPQYVMATMGHKSAKVSHGYSHLEDDAFALMEMVESKVPESTEESKDNVVKFPDITSG